MPHPYRSRPTAGHVVNTEMTGAVPSKHGPAGGAVITQSGCLPIRILDASSAGVRAPKVTPVMQDNRVPLVRQGLSRKGR